jgi:hypothetical protein
MKVDSRAGSNAPHGGPDKILKFWPVQTSTSFPTPNVWSLHQSTVSLTLVHPQHADCSLCQNDEIVSKHDKTIPWKVHTWGLKFTFINCSVIAQTWQALCHDAEGQPTAKLICVVGTWHQIEKRCKWIWCGCWNLAHFGAWGPQVPQSYMDAQIT